jgi:cyclopropane fatty-acyl-phospholipid synthase-like methyltransferase
MTTPSSADVRRYWDAHIHDLEISGHDPGTPGFFADLDQYHFEKLHHLLRLVPFDGMRGKKVLEIGCGAGTDLVRFAKGGAEVYGVDVAESAIALAKKNFEIEGSEPRTVHPSRRERFFRRVTLANANPMAAAMVAPSGIDDSRVSPT